jgi:hypothetical protein
MTKNISALKRKPSNTSATETNAPASIAEAGLRKKAKIDESVFNPNTLRTKKEINKLKKDNEVMSDAGKAQHQPTLNLTINQNKCVKLSI